MTYRTRDEPVSQLLSQLRVATPCPGRWRAMDGGDRVRRCRGCGNDVYNVSTMSRADAEDFLHDETETPCAGFFRRDDGTLITSDCPVGRSLRVARVLTILLGGPILFGLLLAVLAMAARGHVGCALLPR